MAQQPRDLQIVNVVSLSSNSKNESPTTSAKEERPLLELIKHLVNYVTNEEKTISNTQLLKILHQEFNIDVWQTHTLEVEIYMNLLKKFLKSWPRWDAVDAAVQSAGNDKSIDVEKKLFEEYVILKNYLQSMIEMCKEPTDEAVQKIKDLNEKPTTIGVMEISCTRKKLYSLFYQRPNPKQKMTIFNVKEEAPVKITTRTPSLQEIFNWPSVNIYIVLEHLELVRKNSSEFKLTLINRKLKCSRTPPPICTDILCKNYGKAARKPNLTSKSDLLQIVDSTLDLLENENEYSASIAKKIFQLIREDISMLNDAIDRSQSYKYTLSRPYVRHFVTPINDCPLSKDEEALNNFDLVLEEYIIPSITFYIVRSRINYRVNEVKSLLNEEHPWLKIECTVCNFKIEGIGNLKLLLQHFENEHASEQDWRCSVCDETFTFEELAGCKWIHNCKGSVAARVNKV